MIRAHLIVTYVYTDSQGLPLAIAQLEPARLSCMAPLQKPASSVHGGYPPREVSRGEP